MGNEIKISVLLCTYNDEKFIAKTIESVLNQTYPHFEFVIINDGSTDETGTIIDSFHDGRIRHIRKENSGLTASLNYGISECRYDWIARIDGDDMAHPQRFEKQVQVIRDGIAVIGTRYILIDENDREIGKVKLPLKHRAIMRKGLSAGVMFNHPSVLIRKEMLQNVGGYDPLIEAAEDLDLWLMISSKGALVNLPEYLMFYRMHGNKVSVLKREMQFQNMEIAVQKHRDKIYRHISPGEYLHLKERLEKNLFYRYARFLNKISAETSGILLKFINLQIRILTYILH